MSANSYIKLHLTIVILFCNCFKILSQTATPDCSTTTFTLCDNSVSIKAFYYLNPVYGNIIDLPSGNNVSNPTTNPGSTNAGCLFGNEVSPSWSIMEVVSAGTLGFYIGAGGNQSGFLDWAMWPYDSMACNAIISNSLAPVRCNWNASNAGGTGIGPVPTGGVIGNFEPLLNVNAGDKFIICLNNYSNVGVNSWSFQKIGTASLGCGITTSVSENDKPVSISIWPNPSSEMFNVSSHERIGEVFLYNISGELLKKYFLDSKTATISLVDFNSGTYILKSNSGYYKLVKID